MTRVVLTQPAPRVSAVALALRARHHEVVELPFARLVSLLDQPAVAQRLAALDSYDCAVLVSPGAVEIVCAALPAGWPANVALAVVGPGSLAALREHGIDDARYRIHRPALPPFDSQALLREPPFDAPSGLRIVVLRGAQGRTDWIDTLRQRGAQVDAVPVYRSEPVAPLPDAADRIAGWADQRRPVAWIFTSVDAVQRCADWLSQTGRADVIGRQSAFALHPRIVQALGQHGWRQPRLIEPGEAALAAALEFVT